jgi:diaminopimelate epimerase
MPLFSKYSGAGNDFVLVREEELGLHDAAALAQRICPRETGVGVDGLITVSSRRHGVVRIRFFNPDGSEFSTCGNGSRCAAQYTVDQGLTGADHTLKTDDGEILARVSPGSVSLDYSIDVRVEREFSTTLQNKPHNVWLVSIGTPHLVIPVGSVDIENFEELCQPLRGLAELGEQGANVDLVAREGASISVRTFERGVEGETLACGSGCMAAAFVLRQGVLTRNPVEIMTRSGTTLRVEFLEGGQIRLIGPAVFLFNGVFPDAEE